MAALFEFLSRLYTWTIVLFTLLHLELVILIRSVPISRCDHDKHEIATTRYLKFIDDRIPATRYRKNSKPDSTDCAVCLSEFEEGEKIRRLKCKHTFHKDCLDKWLQQYFATCPLCRDKVLPDEIVDLFHRQQNQVDYHGSDEEIIFFLSALHGNSLHRIF